MNAIAIDYKDLSGTALIAIFRLADRLGCTPMEATSKLLQATARKQLNKTAA